MLEPHDRLSDDASREIWDWVHGVLEEVSDEIGTEARGRHLLVYEGWSSFCVEPAWDPDNSDEANEDAAYEYAADESGEIIRGWVEEYDARYQLVHAEYQPTGWYGVTWALFQQRP